MVIDMPPAEYADTRTDSKHIGKKIKQLIDLILTQGMSFYKAADRLGIPHQRARRASGAPHVISYGGSRNPGLSKN